MQRALSIKGIGTLLTPRAGVLLLLTQEPDVVLPKSQRGETFSPEHHQETKALHNSLCVSGPRQYPALVICPFDEPSTLAEVVPGSESIACGFGDAGSVDLPNFLRRFLQATDLPKLLSQDGSTVLVERSSPLSQSLLYTPIRYVTQPKQNKGGTGLLARVEMPRGSQGLDALFLSAEAIGRYFYALDQSNAPNRLYTILGVPETATPADLRTAWRLRQLELGLRPANPAERVWIERSFNVLAHPDLRNCYDATRHDEDAPLIFPYGGFGSILVAGRLSPDAQAFFADRILAYKPEMKSRKLTLLLRQCEFFADRIVCRDPRRKIEVMLDSCLLPGIRWDLTWNHWKHWLRSRIDVRATLVRTGKYRLRKGEWVLRTWHTALPSRLEVTMAGDIAMDVERARAIHALLGEHADVVGKIRAEVEAQPVEHVQIQEWFDRLGASSHLKPQHVTWGPDYDSYYFEQLRRRSTTWFLFRREYLFVWTNVLVAEIPELGHATYIFAKPEDVRVFMCRYSCTSREDIRRNRDNVATDLVFVGRVVRGRRKKRWFNDVLKVVGDKADYVEVFE